MSREIHGESADWSISDHLLAAAVDHLAVANWMFQCVNTSEDDDAPEAPKPVPRPGVTSADDEESAADHAEGSAEEVVSPVALARFFG
ncbi:hypothetical protein [Streptomyces sp. NPDC127092]|uniref:hypothetical protein n=1 Tax=Streptomyces sp. NPDC127092 TaxID=3347135 RepID=UPI0036586017